MAMQSEQKEYGLFRSVFGSRPDEPIAELIDIIYSFFVTYFAKIEDKHQSESIEPTAPHESNSGNQSETKENTENEEKVNELLYETAIEENEVEMTSATPVGELM